MRPFQGYGHFCTRCSHTEKAHNKAMPTMATYPLQIPEDRACSRPGCDCRYYYEGADG